MTNKNIFIACDTSNLREIKKIINNTKTNKLQMIPKFGLQFFYSKNGRIFLQNFKRDYWLDLKINDIPQTALSAIDSLKDLKRCKYTFSRTWSNGPPPVLSRARFISPPLPWPAPDMPGYSPALTLLPLHPQRYV